MAVVSIILQIILGIMFAFLGISSLIGAKKAMENFKHLGTPNWFRYLTGLVQLIGGVSMLIGIWNLKLAVFGGLWLFVTMIVAVALHIKLKDPFSENVPAIIIGLISFAVFLLNK